MRPIRRGAPLLAALLALALLPDPAAAWGPGTHVHLGLEVLSSLSLLPSSVAGLLSSHALEYLYGSLAADIPMGKSYAPADRHPHAWHVGRETLESAGDDPALRAFGLGYLSHLAADVGAHERFVPRMLLLTSSTRALGHSYWEHRMDARVGGDRAQLARSVVLGRDHGRLDRHLDQVLDRTLFSFDTNRRIFRGMVRIADDRRWQSLFDTVVENSRWDLEEPEVELYLRDAFELVAGYLVREGDSRAAAGDPTGRNAVTRAKRVRRQVLMDEGFGDAAASLHRAADRYFPLPGRTAGLWDRRGGSEEVAEDLRRRLADRAALPRAG